MDSFQIRAEMNAQLRRIEEMSAAECLDFMGGLYEHDLDENSPLSALREEAKDQCRRDYEGALSPDDKADWRWVDAMVANAKGVKL